MYYPGTDIAQRVMRERVEDCMRHAERRQMLEEAGIAERSWPVRLACPVLIRTGGLLVHMGQRLQAFGAPPVGGEVGTQAMVG